MALHLTRADNVNQEGKKNRMTAKALNYEVVWDSMSYIEPWEAPYGFFKYGRYNDLCKDHWMSICYSSWSVSVNDYFDSDATSGKGGNMRQCNFVPDQSERPLG